MDIKSILERHKMKVPDICNQVRASPAPTSDILKNSEPIDNGENSIVAKEAEMSNPNLTNGAADESAKNYKISNENPSHKKGASLLGTPLKPIVIPKKTPTPKTEAASDDSGQILKYIEKFVSLENLEFLMDYAKQNYGEQGLTKAKLWGVLFEISTNVLNYIKNGGDEETPDNSNLKTPPRLVYKVC